MSEVSDVLKKYASDCNLKFDDVSLEKFELYSNFLLEWNKKINLTAITEPRKIAIKHFLDSLSMLKYVDLPKEARVIDVGTGAGFPGVPLKILKPDIELTLVDSLNKRVVFLNSLLEKLELKSEVIHNRAESLAALPEYRESFDIVTSRAVALMNILAEYCLPFAKVGGIFVALKSSNVDFELKDSKSAINILGGEVASVNKFVLPEDNPRTIVCIKKVSKTDAKYPRVSSKIAKKPL